MKKILLFTLLLANFFFANASSRVSAYRWRNNDGNETTATWKAALNTPLQINNLDAIRIRIAVEEAGNGNQTTLQNLIFSIDGGTNWINITDTSSPFSLISTPNVVHESSTTQQIATGNNASFVSGKFFSANSAITTTLAGNSYQFTELEFSIKPSASISTLDKYIFTIRSNNFPNIQATNAAVLTYCPFAPPVVSSPQNFHSSAKVSDLAATGTDLKWYTTITGGTELDATTNLTTGLYYLQTASCESTRTPVQVNINGVALNFAGGYVNLPINMPATYTKEAWIKGNDFSGSHNVISGGGDGMHAIYVYQGHLSSGHNGAWETVIDNEMLNTGVWYHVVVTYDADGTMKLYKNGVQVSVATNVPAFTGNFIRIGAFEPGQNLFNGTIDEARIWNKVLTEAEIQENMNCEFAGTQPGLVAYYKFNQGFEGADNSAVTSLTDSSGNGNDGTLVNFDLSANSSNWIGDSKIVTGKTCTTLSVGDHNLDFSSSLKVYPNPSSSAFFINSDSNGTIILFDLLGKIIQTQKLNSGTTTLDLGNTPNGVYLLKVTNEKNQSKTVKLIKN